MLDDWQINGSLREASNVFVLHEAFAVLACRNLLSVLLWPSAWNADLLTDVGLISIKHSNGRFLVQCAANSGSPPPIQSLVLYSAGKFLVHAAEAHLPEHEAEHVSTMQSCMFRRKGRSGGLPRFPRCAGVGLFTKLQSTVRSVGLESPGLLGVLGFLTSMSSFTVDMGTEMFLGLIPKIPHRAPCTVLEVGATEHRVIGRWWRQLLHDGSDG